MATYLEKEIVSIDKLKSPGYAAFGGSRGMEARPGSAVSSEKT